MIKFQNVFKYYPTRFGKRLILDDLNIEFDKGVNVGLLGKNGAGKSTLFRLLAGSEPCDSGTIERNGTVSWPLGFSGGFHGSLSGRENVRFVSKIYGQNSASIFNFVSDFSDLGKYLDMPVRSYSSGMRARLAFGLSMAIDFDFYLIDEVIAVGDAAFRKKCKEMLDQKRRRSTIIMISHSNSILREFCDTGAVLNNGALSSLTSISEAIQIHERIQFSNG
ncbi:ABC transporter ATP-binding protein [Brucella pituitosa]|uniref:ABC transporter ATP-binding protein n=1 Tax=Brucella pituitosa TaxID=571256 RepID=UPI003F4ADC3C